MNTAPVCLHCTRPIRQDGRAYAANGGFYHWECTEPPRSTEYGVGVMYERFDFPGRPLADGTTVSALPSLDPSPVETARKWSHLSDDEVLRIAPIRMPLGYTVEEREGFCAGFRRCARELVALAETPTSFSHDGNDRGNGATNATRVSPEGS